MGALRSLRILGAGTPPLGYQPFSAATSSSCLKCHAAGTAAVRDRNGRPVSGDFSFLLGKAQ